MGFDEENHAANQTGKQSRTNPRRRESLAQNAGLATRFI